MKLVLLLLLLIHFSSSAFALTSRHSEWMPGIGVGFSPNYLVGLTGSGFSSGTPYTTNYAMEYEQGMSAQFDFRKMSPDAWGLMMGFHFESERSLRKMTLNGLSATPSGKTSTYQTHFIFLAGAYRWDSFFIPIGLTYGITHFKPSTTTPGTEVNTQNGVGSIIGVGWYVDKDFTIEYVGRSALTTLDIKSGSDFESNSGVVATALLSMKYFF